MQTGVHSVEFTIIWLDSPDAMLDFSESTRVCLVLILCSTWRSCTLIIDYNYPGSAQIRGRASRLNAAVV